MIKKLILSVIALCALALPVMAQGPQAPDCQIGPLSYTVAQRTLPYDNRIANCTQWFLYYGDNNSAITIEVDGARDSGNVPGTWSALSTNSTSNPTSLSPSGTIAAFFPIGQQKDWVSVNVSAVTGVTTFTLYGYRPRFGIDPASPVIQTNRCTSVVPITAGAGATVQIVSPVAGRKIYVCGLVLTESVAGTVQLVEGTGALCGTGQTSVTGAMTGLVGTPIVFAQSLSSTFQINTSGDGLCLVNGGAVVSAGYASVVQY
jgi:hypothetical protein